jgi:plastocyanin
MVRFAQIIGATALFSHAVLAAPAVRRDGHESKQYDDSYKEPAQYQDGWDKGSDWKPDDSYKYTTDEWKDKGKYETTTAYHEAPTYGSGEQKWGQSYEDCVSKCVAQYGAPPKEWKPQEPIPPPQGTGVVHTVMVAPMMGVLRYFPFAVNATVGDTIRYVWSTPANHTATLSSALAPCNRSARAEELNWASGVRNASQGTQNFDVLLTTDEQQFFYCSVAEHCEKGMFGMVQPKQGGNNTVSFHMQKWVDSNPDLKAAWANIHEKTKDSPADTWGNNISVDDIPEDSYMDLAKNIIYSRAMFAANPGSLEANSAVTNDGSPMQILPDINTFLSSTTQDPPANVAPGTPTGTVPAASEAASQLSGNTGAGFKTSVPFWVAALVGVVSSLLL